MTRGAIIALALAATALLAIGARLLEAPGTLGLAMGVLALVVGTALAAAAVAGAWRVPAPPQDQSRSRT